MILFVCQCGQRIMHSDKRQPICTRCRDPKPAHCVVCTYRGVRRGRASCKCGAVYECGLYGGVCTPRKPPDNLTTLVIDGQSVEIINLEVPFHSCAGCEGLQIEKPQPACSVCGNPSTTICSGHSPFGMCGEPLCSTCRCRRHG